MAGTRPGTTGGPPWIDEDWCEDPPNPPRCYWVSPLLVVRPGFPLWAWHTEGLAATVAARTLAGSLLAPRQPAPRSNGAGPLGNRQLQRGERGRSWPLLRGAGGTGPLGQGVPDPQGGAEGTTQPCPRTGAAELPGPRPGSPSCWGPHCAPRPGKARQSQVPNTFLQIKRGFLAHRLPSARPLGIPAHTPPFLPGAGQTQPTPSPGGWRRFGKTLRPAQEAAQLPSDRPRASRGPDPPCPGARTLGGQSLGRKGPERTTGSLLFHEGLAGNKGAKETKWGEANAAGAVVASGCSSRGLASESSNHTSEGSGTWGTDSPGRPGAEGRGREGGGRSGSET